jgi:hypothetical protein
MLWLVIEGVCPDLCEKRITLFSDNMPTVSWVTCLASKRSIVAEQLVQALALRLKAMHAYPLTPMHIEGKRNAIGDISSRSFGSNPAWTCASDSDLLTLFNKFPITRKALVDRLPPELHGGYARDFCLVDEAFCAG